MVVSLLLANTTFLRWIFPVHLGDNTGVAGGDRKRISLNAWAWLKHSSAYLYTNDLPVTRSRRFFYAKDICCGFQCEKSAEIRAFEPDIGSNECLSTGLLILQTAVIIAIPILFSIANVITVLIPISKLDI